MSVGFTESVGPLGYPCLEICFFSSTVTRHTTQTPLGLRRNLYATTTPHPVAGELLPTASLAFSSSNTEDQDLRAVSVNWYRWGREPARDRWATPTHNEDCLRDLGRQVGHGARAGPSVPPAADSGAIRSIKCQVLIDSLLHAKLWPS